MNNLSIGLTLARPRTLGVIQITAPSAAGSLPDVTATEGEAIAPINVFADFTGGQIGYALAPSSAPLPAGLSLSPSGQITGTPTAPAATVNIVVRGTNAEGFADTAFSLEVTQAVVTEVWQFTNNSDGTTTFTSAGPTSTAAFSNNTDGTTERVT